MASKRTQSRERPTATEKGPTTFKLDHRDERLWSGDQPVRLTNKTFQLLRFFVENPNRLLTKDEILDSVWGRLHVSEGLVKEYVHDLRLALGDNAKRPKFVETVRGRGYRFIGEIEETNGERTGVVRTNSPIEPPSVAVLPLARISHRWNRKRLFFMA